MKNKNIKIITLINLGILSISVFSCNKNSEKFENTQEITDLLGRKVVVPTDVKKVVCIGAGALRLYSYVGDLSKLCGVENVEKTNSTFGTTLALRPYKEINQTLFDSLPDCGKGGPKNQSAEAEAILSCDPDLVFSLYTSDSSAMDELSNEIGKPVVCLSYGTTVAFDDSVKKSIDLIGKIMNCEEHAKKLNNYIDYLQNDLNERTKNIEDENKPSVYLGCQSYYGTNGFLSSSANYSIFNIANIKNALDSLEIKQVNVTVDLEAIATLKMDKIIVDAGGLNTMKSEYADENTAKIYNSLEPIKNNEVYVQMPYNAYYTNIETAYCDAYYAASVTYPEAFSDIDIESLSDEIFLNFNGKEFYSKYKEKYGGFRKLNLEETFTNYETK